MTDPGINQLATEAAGLHKALELGSAILGRERRPVGAIPDYSLLPPDLLKQVTRKFDGDLVRCGRLLVLHPWTEKRKKTAVKWLARKYDEWLASGQEIYEIGRVQEVEQYLGKLAHRRGIECPPYAQVLMQGIHGAAIRHPEYHLAQDLALLNNLFFDAEEIADDHLRNHRQHSTENCQSLARSVILTCYNLLESFISGLVETFVLENPGAPSETLQKLQNPDRKRSSLKARFEDVPAIIADKEEVMEPFRPVLDPLFGACKWRRDSFVHCEPGPAPTKFGTVKESLFHETDSSTVKETVSLTIQAIRAAWKIIHKNPGPRWLPDPEPSGRFPGIAARLVETAHNARRQD